MNVVRRWPTPAPAVHMLMLWWLVLQVEAALHSADALLSKVSIIGEEPTLKEKVALMLQPAYILKGEPSPPAPSSLGFIPKTPPP